jgi:excisionase family DNA binding protein
MADTLLSSKQVQQRLGVGRVAFHALLHRRELRAYKVGRRIRVSEQELENYLKRSELKQEGANV